MLVQADCDNAAKSKSWISEGTAFAEGDVPANAEGDVPANAEGGVPANAEGDIPPNAGGMCSPTSKNFVNVVVEGGHIRMHFYLYEN